MYIVVYIVVYKGEVYIGVLGIYEDTKRGHIGGVGVAKSEARPFCDIFSCFWPILADCDIF